MRRVLPFLLAATLYMPIVRLPFFWDDVVHFRYVTGVSTEHLLTRAEIMSYYRPVVNLLLKLDSHPHAPTWHLILLLNHLLNIALVGALAQNLGLRSRGVLAGQLIFATYPFSSQAVVWVLAWFHPLILSALLIATLGGLVWLKNPAKWGVLMLAWGAGLLAPFIHENGVLAAPLTLWLVICAAPSGWNWKRLTALLLPMGASAALYLLILLRLDVLGAGDSNTPQDIRFNVAFFAQGLSFPVQFMAGQFKGEPATLASIGAALFIGLMVIVGGRYQTLRRPFLFAAGWFGLACLPAALLLTQTYVTSAPRLLYVGAVGACLILAALIEKWNRRIAYPLLACIILASGLTVRETLRLHEALGKGYNELAAQLQPELPTVVVNAPMWLESERTIFPLGKLGAIFIPDYYALNDFVWLNTGYEHPGLVSIVFWEALDPWPQHSAGYKGTLMPDRGNLHGSLRQAEQVMVFQVHDEARFTAALVGWRTQPAQDGLAVFAESLRLNDIQTDWEDGRLIVRLTWQKLAAPWQLPFYRPFVHILCGDSVLTQSDAAPLDNLYDLDVWGPDETWVDVRRFDVEAMDCLRVRVGLYDPHSGTQALITQGKGQNFLIFDVQ